MGINHRWEGGWGRGGRNVTEMGEGGGEPERRVTSAAVEDIDSVCAHTSQGEIVKENTFLLLRRFMCWIPMRCLYFCYLFIYLFGVGDS